jgi:hypothetical protein
MEHIMNDWYKAYSNPIVGLATVIILSTIMLIGASVLGWDQGVLKGMARPEFARGLITYLFAIVTIGIAVSLTLWVLTGPEPTDANDPRFQRGKEVLALLMGVFGTIVGFYFGAENSKSQVSELTISSIDVDPRSAAPASMITLRAVVHGGTAPYKVGLAQGNDTLDMNDVAGEGGWITKQFQLREAKPGESPFLRLAVQDANGRRADQATPIKLIPKQ